MVQLAAAAARLAADLDHPVYDCFYLALAVQTRQYPKRIDALLGKDTDCASQATKRCAGHSLSPVDSTATIRADRERDGAA